MVKDAGTTLKLNVTPTIIQRSDQVKLRGSLFSGTNEGIGFSSLVIIYDSKPIKTISTASNGSFESILTIPQNTSLGNITIHVHYPGTNVFAEANAEQQILVQSKTHLVIISPSQKQFHQNQTFILSGIITDDINQPLAFEKITLTGGLIQANATTNKTGSFNSSIHVPVTFSPGSTAITATYKGNQKYLALQHQIQILILPQDSSNESYLFYLLAGVVIAFTIVIIIVFVYRKRRRYEEIQQSLEDIISEALSRLQTEPDHRKTVLDCYKKMCELLLRKGVIKDAAQTPREFALVAQVYLRVPPENLYDLTKVFEKARYSSREISESDRAKAIRCLRKIVFAPLRGRREKKSMELTG
jgi:hypothetical protein